ncbi:Rv3654c family TadE-like protein [Mycobacterium sp. 852013-50091_SCH5140682]|uniref:Rv3654c family TadE-like protein n=1 Tax=Mycobacterium sp. 852013-50091_SCH5140682 TaxID=1834109 RepID=UPI0018D3DFD8|nr:Rv3654c family TadE-like protein [Mycobacterium sp. 852013-50091_SCH5140682]
MCGDAGSASVLAAAMIGVLVTFTAAGASLGAAVIARHRAQAAADLGALAAAGALIAGPDAACRQAATVASAMRTTVAQCRVDGLDVVLTVHAEVRLGRWGIGPATAAARAGPSETASAA